MEEKQYEQEENEETVEEQTIEDKIFALDVKAQEIEILLDQYEEKAFKENIDLYDDEQYISLNKQYKEIVFERKQLKKELNSKDQSKLNQVSVWIIIYGVLTILISFPIITGTLWLDFANGIIDLVSGAFSNLRSDDFLYKIVIFLIIFAFPLLLNILTWFLYNNFVKTKVDKKLYTILWIIQGLMNLGMIIYMSIQLYGA